jgi:AcrR family transcriptional regulator
VGRPREHDEATRAKLLAAAERIIERGGPDALSIRGVADEAETTTRAVYTLFGSKDGLLVAVAMQAFAALKEGLLGQPETSDPARDIVELGANMYRRFVSARPSLFRLAFQRIAPGLPLGPEFFDARAATWAVLEARFRRLEDAGLLGRRSVTEAAVEFNALCEGLGNAELRGGTMVAGEQEPVWRDAFTALVAGFSATGRNKRGRAKRRAGSGR